MSITTLKALLRQKKIEAFLVSHLTNIRYLTGLDVSSGLLLVHQGKAVFFTDSRYIEYAKKHAKGYTVLDLSNLESVLTKIKQCAFEAEEVKVAQLDRWKKKFKNTKFVQSTGLVEGLRRVKDKDELRSFKQAQRITQKLFVMIQKYLKVGITEKHLAFNILEWALELGADGMAFDPIVGFGKHTSSPHHHPTDKKLKRGDIVQIDIGARVKGYCSDQSRVFFTGTPTKRQLQVLDALMEAKRLATLAVKAGVTTHALDKIARDHLKIYGFEKYFTHSLGHGVGLDIHEGVSISQRGIKEKLLKNEIITIEPGVYFPGKFGMRIEDEIVVP